MADMGQRRLLTVEEYFEREVVSEERHEFWDAVLRMVSGNTDVHCEIVMNVGMLLREHLRERNASFKAFVMRRILLSRDATVQ